MNRVELEAYVAEKTEVDKDTVAKVLDGIIEVVTEALANGDDVRIVRFLSLGVKERAARVGKNPKTGEAIMIPASRRVALRIGKPLARAINGE
jgi:Bacterial nucleoid DNA-binding protein